jgi:hypothetical protein
VDAALPFKPAMSTDPPAKWSRDDERLLHHEAFVAEVLQQRAKLGTGDRPKPAWQRFLESTGGAALVTVLLGGLLGQCITSQVQKGQRAREHQQALDLKEREFKQTWLKARGDQALIAYQDYLKEEKEVTKRAYELIGSCISASDDLMALTDIDYNPYHPDYGREDRKLISEQRVAMKDKYIEADAKWRAEREQLGLLMAYYHKGREDIDTAWRATQEAVTGYMAFAEDWERKHPEADLKKEDIDAAARDKKAALQATLSDLGKTLEQGRRYAWEGWDSIENLNAILEGADSRQPAPAR